IPQIPADDGRSYARQSLPAPPNFPTPAPPEYQRGQMVATREAFGTALRKLAAVHPKIVALDGDVKNSTFTEVLEKAYPDRLYQGYIAEQNLVGVGVGLAAQGQVPFVATFACFLSRAGAGGPSARIRGRDRDLRGPVRSGWVGRVGARHLGHGGPAT